MKCYNGNSVCLRIIYVCVKKYQQAFLAPLPGNGCHIFFKPNSSLYLYLLFFLLKNTKYFYHDINSYPKVSYFKGQVFWATTFQNHLFIWLWTLPWLDSHGSGTTLLWAWKWKPLQSPARVRGNVFVPEHLRHDIRNSKVEIVSLFSHREGEAMVHTCRRKYEWWLGWT